MYVTILNRSISYAHRQIHSACKHQLHLPTCINKIRYSQFVLRNRAACIISRAHVDTCTRFVTYISLPRRHISSHTPSNPAPVQLWFRCERLVPIRYAEISVSLQTRKVRASQIRRILEGSAVLSPHLSFMVNWSRSCNCNLTVKVYMHMHGQL